MKKYLNKTNLIIAGIILVSVIAFGFGNNGNIFSFSVPAINNNSEDHGHSH